MTILVLSKQDHTQLPCFPPGCHLLIERDTRACLSSVLLSREGRLSGYFLFPTAVSVNFLPLAAVVVHTGLAQGL